MSMPLLDIHKSNEVEIVVSFARFGKTCISTLGDHNRKHVSFTSCGWNGNKTQGH
jgi:hypothetical protein